MKKSVSLLISLCLAVTSAAAAITPAASSADDSRKGFSISTYRDSDSIYAALGNTVTIPTSYVNEGDVVIPCALYYTEQTNDTQTISVQLTINSEDGDPKSPTFADSKLLRRSKNFLNRSRRCHNKQIRFIRRKINQTRYFFTIRNYVPCLRGKDALRLNYELLHRLLLVLR